MNATTMDGDAPLHYATGYDAWKIAEYLIEQGANVNATNDDGESPLHSALLGKRSNLDVVKKLVTHGANINAPIKYGRSWFTPADIAAVHYHDDVYKFLLRQGGKCNRRNYDSRCKMVE